MTDFLSEDDGLGPCEWHSQLYDQTHSCYACFGLAKTHRMVTLKSSLWRFLCNLMYVFWNWLYVAAGLGCPFSFSARGYMCHSRCIWVWKDCDQSSPFQGDCLLQVVLYLYIAFLKALMDIIICLLSFGSLSISLQSDCFYTKTFFESACNT